MYVAHVATPSRVAMEYLEAGSATLSSASQVMM